MPEGWGFPGPSVKRHYYVSGLSLCRKWMYAGDLKPAERTSPNDCVTCARKLERRLVEKERE